MKYSGCIIEESLKDKSIINEFNILEEINDEIAAVRRERAKR